MTRAMAIDEAVYNVRVNAYVFIFVHLLEYPFKVFFVLLLLKLMWYRYYYHIQASTQSQLKSTSLFQSLSR